MNIPDEAIDAATAAIMVTEGRTENVRSLAARIVSAAAPIIAAQAWDEAAAAAVWEVGGFIDHPTNPYRKEGTHS